MSEGKKIDILTFLRGFSILAIIVFHYLLTLNLQSPFDTLIYGGGTGVHLFVLLSGFGLYYSQLKKPLSYFAFLKKRLTKIYIPYVFIVAFSAMISFIIPIYPNSLYAFFGHIFFYKMFDETIVGSYGNHLWFISMIIQFYFVFKLIIYIKQKISKTIIVFTVFLMISISWSIAVYYLGHSTERVWNSFFLQYLWEFVLGMLLAENIETIEKYTNKYRSSKPLFFKLFFLVVGTIALGLYGFIAIKLGEFGRMFNDISALIGFSFFAIFIYLLNIKHLNHFFIFSGKISFSLYLTHMLVLNILMNYYSSSIILVFLSIILCYFISYYYQKLADKITKRI